MIPKKKPEYNASANVEEMIQAISEYYGEPYDDRDENISEHISLRQTAEHFGITVMKARKLLITAGRYSTETSRAVQELAAHGLNIAEIMKKTGLGRSSVHSYIAMFIGIETARLSGLLVVLRFFSLFAGRQIRSGKEL